MATPDEKIRPIEWVPASEVHPHEAHDFTPWLSRNLHLIGDVLGFDEIELSGTEVRVGDYRLDLLAEGQLGEARWPVAIENQYRATDHRHLGQLITYLAQHEQGHAVWIVEDASDQHIAAIEFLNRTTVADFGYWLLRVRFTPSGDGYQVYFDVLSRPNTFIREGNRSDHPGGSSSNRTIDERYEFHASLFDRLQDDLTAAGWRNVGMHRGGWHIRMRYPRENPLSDWGTVIIRSLPDHFYVHIRVREGNEEENRAVVDLLRDHYESALEAALPNEAEIRWHEAAQSADAIKIIFRGDGYYTDPDIAAEWLRVACEAWLHLVTTSPIEDLEARVVERSGDDG